MYVKYVDLGVGGGLNEKKRVCMMILKCFVK